MVALSSLVVDFFAKLKVSSNHLTQGILSTLPLPSKAKIQEFADDVLQDARWFEDRAIELLYVSWDLAEFAKEVGDTPNHSRSGLMKSRWFWLRCEIDAAFFHLILGTPNGWERGGDQSFASPREAVKYMLEAFSVLNRKEENRFEEIGAPRGRFLRFTTKWKRPYRLEDRIKPG